MRDITQTQCKNIKCIGIEKLKISENKLRSIVVIVGAVAVVVVSCL